MEKILRLNAYKGEAVNLSGTSIKCYLYYNDMIGQNRENDQDIFQIFPGKSSKSLFLALKTPKERIRTGSQDKKNGTNASGPYGMPQSNRVLKVMAYFSKAL